MVIAGDLNFPQVIWIGKEGTGGRAQNLVNTLVREGNFTQVVHYPTRMNSVLDIFLLKTPELVKTCNVLPGISDHEAVYLELYWNMNINAETENKIVYSFHRANGDAFRHYLRNEFEEWARRGSDIEDIWVSFKQILNKGIDAYVPIKKLKRNADPEYYNAEIRRLKRKSRDLHKMRKICRENENKYREVVKLINGKKKEAEN